jgi:hypothetical protein
MALSPLCGDGLAAASALAFHHGGGRLGKSRPKLTSG